MDVKKKPTISNDAMEMLVKHILRPSDEKQTTELGEFHWNACKRHILRCIETQFVVVG